MIGKSTMENYILKKREYILWKKRGDSSIITSSYFPPSDRGVK